MPPKKKVTAAVKKRLNLRFDKSYAADLKRTSEANSVKSNAVKGALGERGIRNHIVSFLPDPGRVRNAAWYRRVREGDAFKAWWNPHPGRPTGPKGFWGVFSHKHIYIPEWDDYPVEHPPGPPVQWPVNVDLGLKWASETNSSNAVKAALGERGIRDNIAGFL